MKEKLAYVGASMAVLGFFAIVLDFLNRVPRILVWIYNWGDTVAWVIKIGLIVVGVLLYMFAPGEEDSDEESEENEKDAI